MNTQLADILIEERETTARAHLALLQDLKPTAIAIFTGATCDTSQRAAFLSLYVALASGTGDFNNSQEACTEFERWITA